MEEKKLFSDFPPISTEAWEQQIQQDLKGADYEKKLVWKTLDGFSVKPYYRADDLAGIAGIGSLPGHFPFVRGYDAKKNEWEICQFIDTLDISEANKRAVKAIERGAKAVSFRLDYINNLEEITSLLKNIDLTQTPIHFVSFHSYSILADLMVKEIARQGLDAKKVKGSFNFDSFGYYLLNGSFYNSHSDNMNELRCLIDFVRKNLPGFCVVNINAQHFHNAGASNTQELGFALASALEYIHQMTEMGMKVEEVIPNMQITFAIGGSYFMEIAKLRAARILWSRIAEQFVPGNTELAKICMHSISSTWNKTLYDVNNNMLRNTTEAMSAILGGANRVTILPHDFVMKESDEFGDRIARNVQLLLKEECHFDEVVDPAGGSYYIEKLTDSIVEYAWKLFLLVEEKGGFKAAMESGFIKEEIEKIAQQRDMNMAMRRTTIVGVNNFPNMGESIIKQITKPVKTNAKAPNALRIYRGTQEFEELRLAVEAYIKAGGIRPKVFLATYGNLTMRKARATFATNFFGIGGYEIYEQTEFNNVDWTMNKIKEQRADFVVICSSDEEYADIAPLLTKEIKKVNADVQVIIAGNPTELIEPLKNAGVDDFIHVRTNALEFLRACHAKSGIVLK